LNDLELLDRYVATRDPDCFRKLVLSYQGLVYNTCRRVLKEHQVMIEDAVQETFLTLSRNAAQVRSNVGAWLHTCATNVSISLQRSERARKVRERQWSESAQRHIDAMAPTEITALVDECLSELPDDQREVVVQYYLMSRTEAEIAANLNINRVAVHRRIAKAMDALRDRLTRRGLATGVALLMVGSLEAAPVPQALTASVMKLGLASLVGAGKITGRSASAKVALGLLAASSVMVLAIFLTQPPSPPPSSATPSAFVDEPSVPALDKNPNTHIAMSIDGSIPSSPTTTLGIIVQATKHLSPTGNAIDGRVLIYSKSTGDQTFIFTTKILDASADDEKGLGAITAEYVFRNKTYQVSIERSLDAIGRAKIRYSIFSGGKLVSTNWQGPEPVIFTGTSSVRSHE